MLISDRNEKIENFIRLNVRFDLTSNAPICIKKAMKSVESEINPAEYRKIISGFNDNEAVFYGEINQSDVVSLSKIDLFFEEEEKDHESFAVKLCFFKMTKSNGEVFYHEKREEHSVFLIDFYDEVKNDNFEFCELTFKDSEENGNITLMSMKREEGLVLKSYMVKNTNKKTILEEDLNVEKRNKYSGKISISSENFENEKELFLDLARKMKRLSYSLKNGEIISE